MRIFKTILLILVVCLAGFLFLRPSAPKENRVAEPAVSYPSVSKPVAEILAVQAGVAQADTNFPAASEICSECGKVHAGHVCVMYGGQKIMTLSNLPPGNVKSAVEKLPVEAQQRALLKLSRMNFQSADEASVRVDAEGSIYYVCSFTNTGMPVPEDIPVAEAGVVTWNGALTNPLAAPLPVSSPPIYHSKPGATKVLFLDFNGADISNTFWNNNSQFGNEKVWHCRPFSADTDETTFNDTEQRYIREMWERVAEDYAVYDVDVTTEQPAVWTQNTAHALITPTVDANGKHCPHYNYGGIAYLGVFGQTKFSYNDANCYSPAWVNSTMSGNSYANTAEAASHELGHNLGLDHDGTIINGVTSDYYYGHGNWAPIMGAAYGKNVSQWSKGEYYGANRFEDDLSILNSKLTYKPDDYGNTIAQAAVFATNGGVFSVTGILERASDSDMFSFACSGGMLALTGTTYRCSEGTWGGNADLVLTLYDAGGSVLATNNPALETWAVITQAVAAGTYYLKVSPTGVGNPTNNPPTGYTSYGSIGPYTIAGCQYLTCTVTFDAQGGAVSPASINVTYDSTYGTLPTPTRTSYTFGGWWTGTDGTGSQVLSTTTVTITSDQTLYAKWTVSFYTLTINNGTGGGSYTNGQQVAITAADFSPWSVFDQWSGDTAYVNNVTYTNAMVTMPAQDIALTANHTALLYTLTVNNGTGSGIYWATTEVSIMANSPPEGLIFDQWIGDTGALSSNTASTTVTMPEFDTAVTATYKSPAVLLTAAAGANGMISPPSTNVTLGSNATFMVTASNYYRIATLTTNGTAVTGISFDNTSTFTNFIWSNVQAAGTVTVAFVEQVVTNPAVATVPYSWMAGYGLTNYEADAVLDQDSDGLTVWQEYIAGTDPTNRTSSFKVNTFKKQANGVVIQWSPVTDRVYGVYWTTNLKNSFQSLETNIVWPQGSYTDTVHGAESRSFYNVKVQLAP